MDLFLEEIIIYQKKTFEDYHYIKIQSEHLYFSSTSIVPFQNNLKYNQRSIPISSQYPLKIQIWNYSTVKLIKNWIFDKQDIQRLRVKPLINDYNWSIYLKISSKSQDLQNNKQNINKLNRLKSQNHIKMRPKLKTYNDKINHNKKKRLQIMEVLDNKSRRDKKSVKKALKNTIDYLIKKQKVVDHDYEQQKQKNKQKNKLKSGKCTPIPSFPSLPSLSSLNNVFSPQNNNSAIFVEYGLNNTQQDKQNLQKIKSKLAGKSQFKKKQLKIR